MRTFYSILLSLAVVGMASCNWLTPTQEVNISISPATAQMKVGEITTLEVTGASANIEWSSSNEDVATVYHGVVTAVAIGKAEIIAKVGNATANSIIYVSGTDGATLRISPPVVMTAEFPDSNLPDYSANL